MFHLKTFQTLKSFLETQSHQISVNIDSGVSNFSGEWCKTRVNNIICFLIVRIHILRVEEMSIPKF